MTIVLVIFLAVVQGLTEFLPVSSSGHLVVSRAILSPYLGKLDSPLAFDILIHLATALVTAFFLRKELLQLLKRMFLKEGNDERRLVSLLIVATVPAVFIGFGFKDQVENLFDTPQWALNGFLITAVVLELAHRHQVKLGSTSSSAGVLDWQFPTYFQAVIIGCAQAMAIMPGVSRSGSTIALALLLSLPARSAVMFSFFMLLPVVAGAAVLELGKLQSLESANMAYYLCGFLVTCATAYLALKFLVWVVEGAKLRWFAIYTLLLGLGLRLLV